MARWAWLAGISAVVIAACSSSSSNGGSSSGGVDAGGDDAATDAGGDDATPGDGSGGMDAGPCGIGANLGAKIDVQQTATDPPAAMGGTIADGTYVLTSATLYTGAGGATGSLGLTLAQTWHFSGTAYAHVSFDQMSMLDVHQSGTYASVSAISLHLIQTCPDSDFGSEEYTATPTGVTFYSMDASGTLALFLARQ
ncbi:MAG TPA: hypothetical protein VIF62_06600 [Labilithrix sp.]